MKISKSFKIYIHIILAFLISKNVSADTDFSKNIVIYEKPKIIEELKFKDLNLQEVDLTNKKGNIMILNFWATWCAPCRREMPSLEKLTFELPEIKVYAINMEKPNKLKAQDFFKFIGVLSLDIYFDPELKLVKQFKMRGLPTSILIDKNGKEFGRIVGEIDFTNKEFIKILKNRLKIKNFKNLKETLKVIFSEINIQQSKKNIIFFSPSGASFDSFKNFEDRGHFFNQIIKKYINAKR